VVSAITGQDPVPIITKYTFVEQETNWQADNCNHHINYRYW